MKIFPSDCSYSRGLRRVRFVENGSRVRAGSRSGVLIVGYSSFAFLSCPSDAVDDLLRQSANCRLVVVLQEPDQEMTLDLFRRGAHGIVSREVEPELLVECLRKVAQNEPWLESRAVAWVMQAYRTQGLRPSGSRPKVSLTPKEALIVSCVTQGMKNKEIAVRVGTTEQVAKKYLRKVYDKLGVADRLELALFCLNHRVLDGAITAPARLLNRKRRASNRSTDNR